jgi:hypothetical protein
MKQRTLLAECGRRMFAIPLPHAALTRQWHALCDPHAYAQCLRDIDAARNKASTDYEDVESIAQTKAQDPQDPWFRYETVALRRANRSHNVLLRALQRFTAEQKRVRQNGVFNADKTSRNWTKDLEAETRRRSGVIKRLWGLGQARARENPVQAQAEDQNSDQDEDAAQEDQLAQDWALAEDQLQAQSRPNTRSENGFDAAGPVDERTRADDENAEDPEPIDGVGEDAEPRPQRSSKKKRKKGKKRRRKQDDEDVHSDAEDVVRPQKKTRRLTRRRPATPEDEPEEKPANDAPSGDPPLPEPEPEEEEDPAEEFERRWTDFLAKLDDQDRPEWEKQYLRAQELFPHTQKSWMLNPGEDSIDDRVEFEKHITESLGEAIN